jgi:signal transduction histidine kinase
MSKKRRWLWVLLFIGAALILSALATGWNVVLVRDYQHILKLAKNLSIPGEISIQPSGLVVKMILGTIGFIVVLALTILIFVKLLNEMRLNQLQSEFLATISHELKTPIAAIELSSTLIRSGNLSSFELTQLWDSHQAELNRLRNEVETLLEAARWQSKPILHQQRNVALDAWLAQSFERWKNILGNEAILRQEGVPLQVHAWVDPRSLDLITDNLINNAKKFSKGPPHVVIRTTRIPPDRFLSKSRWQIEFVDHGWGFDPIDSKKIFHRFFRSPNPAPYAISGTGLGLYLASEASRAMNLSLKGKSDGVGLGATFTLQGPEYKL